MSTWMEEICNSGFWFDEDDDFVRYLLFKIPTVWISIIPVGLVYIPGGLWL